MKELEVTKREYKKLCSQARELGDLIRETHGANPDDISLNVMIKKHKELEAKRLDSFRAYVKAKKNESTNGGKIRC